MAALSASYDALPPRRVLPPWTLWILLLAGACNRVEATLPEAPRPVPVGPSVVLVTIDTLRADHVGAYGAGFAHTPTLDRLAAEGIVFENAIAVAPLTLPSHATLLTGLTPPRHAVRHNGLYRLDETTETLAERFQAAGYETGAVVGAVVLAPQYGLDQGFDHYDARGFDRPAAILGYPERTASQVTEAALEWIAERSRPFLLWVHYYDPHATYQAPAPWGERFGKHPYAGEIAYVDEQLGRLFEGIRAAGWWDDTVLLVTSDHGESLGEHHENTHSYTLYDATLRVPMILRRAGRSTPQRVEDVVSGADVAPTLLALAGLEPLPDVDGRDLGALFDGSGTDAPAGPPAYAETHATRIEHGWAPLHALRSDRHLYVRAPRPELYDVAKDPGQVRNLLEVEPDAHAEAVASLEDQLSRVLAREREATEADLDPETLEQLRSLGYMLPEGKVVESGLDPKDGLPHIVPYQMAKAAFEEGRTDLAQGIAEQIADKLPQSPALHDLLTRIYLRRHDPQGALRHARTALQLLPESSDHQVLLGLAQVAAGDFAAAVAAFEAGLELNDINATAHVGLMWKRKLGGSLEEAEAAADRALELLPESADIHVRIADNWDQLGHYDRALEIYRRAVVLDPDNGDAHVGIAIQLVRLGQPEEGQQAWARAGESAQTLQARMRLAIALAGREEVSRAEALLRGVMAEAPAYAPARRVLSVLLERHGRAEEAQALRAAPGTS